MGKTGHFIDSPTLTAMAHSSVDEELLSLASEARRQEASLAARLAQLEAAASTGDGGDAADAAAADGLSLAALLSDASAAASHLDSVALDAQAPQKELARLIARCADASVRAELFTQASLPQQAAAALAEAAEQSQSGFATRLFGGTR